MMRQDQNKATTVEANGADKPATPKVSVDAGLMQAVVNALKKLPYDTPIEGTDICTGILLNILTSPGSMEPIEEQKEKV